jgi:hypothetical protein
MKIVTYNFVKNKEFTNCVVCGAVHVLQQGVLSFPNVVGLMAPVCVMSHMLIRRVTAFPVQICIELANVGQYYIQVS